MILKLNTPQYMYNSWAPDPHFYPVSGEFNGGHLDAISHYLKEKCAGTQLWPGT